MGDDLQEFRAVAQAWCRAHLSPRARGEIRGHDVTAEQLHADRVAFRAMYDAGFVGLTVPEEYGGRGLSSAHQRVWNQVSAGFEVPVPGGIAGRVTMGIVLPTLLAHASEEQKRSWIPSLLRGDEIWVQLLSEPGAGSDLAGILTRATRDGDVWVLNGEKVWSSGAMSADYGICLARTDWEVPKHKGLTWFKVPLRDERVTVRPVREINGSAEFCAEYLDGVVVADDMVIGDVNDGWRIANTMLACERGAGGGGREGDSRPRDGRLAPDLVALAEGRRLTRDPAVRQLIAKAHVNDYLQAELGRRVAQAIAARKADPSAASLIKLGLGLRDPERAAISMEIAGRTAIAWADDGSPGQSASINFLNGRIFSIAGGSNQIQRNIISERLLGLPKEQSVDSDRPFQEVLRDAKDFGRRR
jgi:alkylation response protein AidB-like acyl-CoA dehydrogenase